jgi:Nif-specific regulatory protein
MTQIEHYLDHSTSISERELETKTLELQALYEISQLVGSALHFDKLPSQILYILHSILYMDYGDLLLLYGPGRRLSIRASYSSAPKKADCGVYSITDDIYSKIFQTCSPFIVPNIHSEPLFLSKFHPKDLPGKDRLSYIGVPIVLLQEPVGVLTVDRLFDLKVSIEEDLHFLGMVATLIGQFLNLYQSIRQEQSQLLEENRSLKAELYKRQDLSVSTRSGHKVSRRCPLKELEREKIESALRRHGWIQVRAAQELGLTQRQIGYRIKKYGLRPPGSRQNG